MRCSTCDAENPSGTKYCGQCGSPFTVKCPVCGAENTVPFKYCRECGTALGLTTAVSTVGAGPERSPIRVSPELAPEVLGGERKTVTALFADIVGSTALEQDLDPEEARAIVDPALKLMIDAVQHYDGYVVQSTGDGIFAVFGAPVAHEDHPQRALYAALRMHDEIRRYADKLRVDGRSPLQIRIGADTGEVVVRTIETGGKTEYTPIGHAANLASRMQSLANPGSTVISESSRKLVEGYFALKPLGASRVKGITEPINVYEVTGFGPLRSRLQRSASRGYTKFVGRRREMEAMNHAAELAKSGHGQIIAAIGEPGVGKSRLFYEFKVKNQSEWTVLEAASVFHGKSSAYFPIIDLLHNYFKIVPEDDERSRRAKVIGAVLALDRTLEDTLPYPLALLGILEGEDPMAQMDAQVRRLRTLDAIKRIFLRESLNRPLMFEFEDLHWIDEETQAFLNLFVEGMANAPVLLLVNYRSEYTHQWGNKTYYTQLRLDPLGKENAEEMLSALLGDGAELGPLRRLIIEKTQGNPLFMEEIIQALLEDGSLRRNGSVRLVRPVGQLKLPPTVQGILAARIDRLPPEAKDLLQTLAVIGMEFPLLLVREVAQRPFEQIDRSLGALQTGEFIYEQPAAGNVEYTFKHALTRDVAYNSVLTERRKLLHDRIGKAIESVFPEQLEDHFRELARHFLLSNDAAKAIRYAQSAAEQARERSAYAEAENLIDAAMRLLDKLPDGEQRLRAELELRAIETALDFVLYGGTSPKRERAITRECEIAERLGEPRKLIRGLVALSSLHWLRGECALGLEVVRRCLELHHLAHEPELLADVYWMAAVLSESSGRLREAIDYYGRSSEAAHDAARAK
jgi:class 3 adenylate cyclase